MTRGTRGRSNISGVRGRDVVDGPRSRDVLEGGRSRQVLLGPRSRNTGGLPAALRDATLFLDAKYSAAGEPRVINRGSGGTALDAKYGSVLGAYVYDGAAVLPGIASNFLSVPDEAALDITGDIEIVARVMFPDWTPASQLSIVSKWSTSEGYELQLETGGTLSLVVDTTGATWQARSSTVAVPFTDGQAGWVKATKTSASGDVRFYTAPDQATEPTSWTQLGTTVAGNVGPLSTNAATLPLYVGARASGGTQSMLGSIYRTIVRDGIDGTTVLDVDMASVADYATSFTATTGQTVTVNSTSSDTNDPLLLTHTGENYVYLPGIADNSLSTPDLASYTPTSTLDVRSIVSMSDWNPGAESVVVGHYTTSTANRSWLQAVATGGNLNLRLSVDGSTNIATDSSAPIPVVDGEQIALRSVWDASVPNVIHYTKPAVSHADLLSDDGWTQLGTERVVSVPASLNAAASDLAVGELASGGLPLNGSVRSVNVRADGLTVFEFNAATDITDAGATSFTATSGQTVTVNRATSGRKTALVTRPVWLFGTDDFLQSDDSGGLTEFAANESFTVMALGRKWATPVSSHGMIQKGASPNSRWFLINSTTTSNNNGFITDGTNSSSATTAPYTLGALHAATMVVDRDGNFVRVYTNNTLGGEDSDISNVTGPVGADNSIGLRMGSGSALGDMEGAAFAVWNRVLTTDEIAALNTYYGTA